jgi:hypothetical protein
VTEFQSIFISTFLNQRLKLLAVILWSFLSFHANQISAMTGPDYLRTESYPQLCLVSPIEAESGHYSPGTGSAVIIAPDAILTAAHVAERLLSFKKPLLIIRCLGEKGVFISRQIPTLAPGRLKFSDDDLYNDLAVVKLDPGQRFNTAPIQIPFSQEESKLLIEKTNCGAFGFSGQDFGYTNSIQSRGFKVVSTNYGYKVTTDGDPKISELLTFSGAVYAQPGDSGGGVICNHDNDLVQVATLVWAAEISDINLCLDVSECHQDKNRSIALALWPFAKWIKSTALIPPKPPAIPGDFVVIDNNSLNFVPF